MKRSILISTAIISLTGCASPKAPASTHAYVPRIREITITTVPLLVREQVSTFPFLAKDFGKGGVLEGKEVYAFSPSTVTVVEGDTIQFTLINPEDDDHSFALPDLVVPLPPQQTARVTYIAKHAGIYPILCTIPKHLPMMSGQFVVLAGTSMAD
jgi:plastocyanin